MLKSVLVKLVGCLTLLLLLCGCSVKVNFPEDDIKRPTPPQDSTSVSDFPISLYLQSTSYMSGFVKGEAEGNRFVSVIPELVTTAKNWDTSPTYYRFDCLSLIEVNGGFPYLINERQFGVDAVMADKVGFYSIPWYFAEAKGERYKQLYQDDGMNYESYYKENYLAETLASLKGDELSVIVTDFVDYDFQTAYDNFINPESTTVTKVLHDMVSTEGKVVSIFIVESSFDGTVYSAGRIAREDSVYKGIRPFYVIVYGGADENLSFCSKLAERLGSLYITDGNESAAPFTFITTGTTQYMDIAFNEDISGKPELTGIQEVFESAVSPAEKNNIGYDEDTLYYEIKADDAQIKIDFPINLPFGMEIDETLNVLLREVTGGIAAGSQNANDVAYVYKEMDSDGFAEARFTSSGNKAGYGAIEIKLDRTALMDTGKRLPGDYKQKYQMIVELNSKKQANAGESLIDRYSVGLAAADGIDDFAGKTVGLADMLAPFIHKAKNKESQKIAYFVIYLVIK